MSTPEPRAAEPFLAAAAKPPLAPSPFPAVGPAMAAPLSMISGWPADPRVDVILDVFILEAAVERSRLTADARLDELGLGSLDLTIALSEIEDHFKVLLLPTIRLGDKLSLGALIGEILRQIELQTASAPAALGRAAR